MLGLHSGLHYVRLLLDEGAHLPLTEQLEEGVRERHVDETVVLQRLGKEHAEEPEELRRPVSKSKTKLLGLALFLHAL